MCAENSKNTFKFVKVIHRRLQVLFYPDTGVDNSRIRAPHISGPAGTKRYDCISAHAEEEEEDFA